MIKQMGVLGFVAAGILVAGCQSNDQPNAVQVEQQRQLVQMEQTRQELDTLKASSAATQQQLQAAQQDADAKAKTIKMLQDELVKAGTAGSTSQEANLKKIGELEKEITLLKAENEQLKSVIKDMTARVPAPAPATRPYLNK